MPVQIYVPENPILAAWRGGSSLAAQPQFEQNLVVTKAEYEEHGHESVMILQSIFVQSNYRTTHTHCSHGLDSHCQYFFSIQLHRICRNKFHSVGFSVKPTE